LAVRARARKLAEESGLTRLGSTGEHSFVDLLRLREGLPLAIVEPTERGACAHPVERRAADSALEVRGGIVAVS
jgi:hypothetical protein